VIAAVLALVALALPLYMVLAARSSVAGAADAAALAAADTTVGLMAGVPCEQADRVARANGAELDSCVADGLVLTVSVSRSVFGFRVGAISTAGPPGSPVD
jgi:secretion/DNA translocation related TadE-like protein